MPWLKSKADTSSIHGGKDTLRSTREVTLISPRKFFSKEYFESDVSKPCNLSRTQNILADTAGVREASSWAT